MRDGPAGALVPDAGSGGYVVVYRRDRDGGWTASVKGVRGCRGRGRTIRAARAVVRAGLEALMGGSGRPTLMEDVRLPGSTRRLIVRHWATMKRAEREAARARGAAREALAALRRLGISLADSRELLGLSSPNVKRLLR